MNKPTLQEIYEQSIKYGICTTQKRKTCVDCQRRMAKALQAISAAMDDIIGRFETDPPHDNGGTYDEICRDKLRLAQHKAKDTFLGGGT